MPTNKPGALLEQDETAGGTPGSPNGQIPETPGTLIQVKARADREYTAASRPQYYINIPRALPFAFDDVQSDFGVDIYARMLLDAQVRSVMGVFKSAILEDGVNLLPAIDQKTEDGYEAAAQAVDDADRMLSDIEQSLDDVLWDMLDAVAFGNRMAEQVYELDTTLSGSQQYRLSRLAVKPIDAAAFVVDVYMQVLGILARIPGQPFPVQQGMLLSDLQHTPNILPRSKFAIFTFRPVNGDPRGTSLLRPAFDPWQQKVQLKREYLKFLTQFATPSLIGYTAEGAIPYQPFDEAGNPVIDAHGNAILQSPEQDMTVGLEGFANGTAIAFPFGAKVQPVEMTGDGSAFLQAFQMLDRLITKSVLHQTLATEEGLHQTRASSSSHKDILDMVTHQAKRPVERMIERDILATWLRLNGIEPTRQILPKVSLGTTEAEDRTKLWAATAALWKAGYLHESQLPALDVTIGTPERTPPTATTAPLTETVAVSEDAGTVPPPDTEGEAEDAEDTAIEDAGDDSPVS